MGRQQQAGGPGQHGHASAPGTVMPAWTGPSPLPTSCKRGSPALRGQGTSLLGQHCLRSVPATAPPGPPSPAGTWRGPCGSPFPPPARKGTGYSPVRAQSLGTAVSLSPGGAQAAQTLTSLRLSTTTKCRSPRARKSLKTRGRDASCKAQQGWGGCRTPQAAPTAPP